MGINIQDISECKVRRIAGFLFLFAFIIPTLNWFLVLSKFNVTNNALATANNIISNEFLFRIGLTVELFMTICLIALGSALYIMLKTVNKKLALFALLLKLVETSIAAVIVLISFIALQIVSSTGYLTVFTSEQLQIPVGLFLNVHTYTYSIPMVFLGLDMIIFSYLFFKARYIPRILAIFGMISFVLIFIHSLVFMLVPQYAVIPIIQIIFWFPSGLFEIIIGIWFLFGIKGCKLDEEI